PPDVEARALAALRKSLGAERERSATRPIRRIVVPPAPAARPQKSTVGFVIAAALFVGFVGLFLMAKQPTPRIAEAPREVVRMEPAVAPQPPPPQQQVEAPPAPE